MDARGAYHPAVGFVYNKTPRLYRGTSVVPRHPLALELPAPPPQPGKKRADLAREWLVNNPASQAALVAATGGSLGEALKMSTWGSGNSDAEIAHVKAYGSMGLCPHTGIKGFRDLRVFALKFDKARPDAISVELHLDEKSSAGPAARFAQTLRAPAASSLDGDALDGDALDGDDGDALDGDGDALDGDDDAPDADCARAQPLTGKRSAGAALDATMASPKVRKLADVGLDDSYLLSVAPAPTQENDMLFEVGAAGGGSQWLMSQLFDERVLAELNFAPQSADDVYADCCLDDQRAQTPSHAEACAQAFLCSCTDAQLKESFAAAFLARLSACDLDDAQSTAAVLDAVQQLLTTMMGDIVDCLHKVGKQRRCKQQQVQ